MVTTEAVKDYLFRSCDQNPFCKRNRHYADHVVGSPYCLDGSTVLFEDNTLTGTIFKIVGDNKIELPLTVSVLESGIRVSIDEKRRLDGSIEIFGNELVQKSRFSVAPYAFAGEPRKAAASSRLSKSTEGSSFQISYGDKNHVEIQTNPFKASFFRNGELQVELNGKGFLNYEHWRSIDTEEIHLGPYELDEGLWEDEFDNHKDKKSRGPESVALDVTFVGYKHVYGIPEHADSLSLRETRGKKEGDHKEPYRLYNVDIFEYETESQMAMYGAIPFMQAHKKGASAGVFWANAADTYIDITKQDGSTTSHWMSEAGLLDVFVFLGDSPAQITKHYCGITGLPALPQTFAIGYHQCRWNYNSQDDVLEVDENFDKHDMPYDVIWLDIEYTVEKQYFTWAQSVFPDHVGMMHKLDEAKRKLVPIIDPHIKVKKDYDVYETVTNKNLAVLNSDGEIFHGHCWPGESVWLDTLNPGLQPFADRWYSKKSLFGGDADNLHIWNDMNEPSVFSGPETTMPRDNIHYGGWEHRDVHNLVGLTYHNLTVNSLNKRYENTQRPFVLTRSFYAGSQRLSAMWTGDNMAKWEYLKAATPMILTQGVAGYPFSGADVGGFFGDPSSELLTRWYQVGVFYPFFRGHAHIDAKRREPYLPPSPYREIIRDSLKLRYKLLPSIYTAFYRAATDALPVMRPLFYEVPGNEEVFAIDDEFFLGDTGLLVKPVTEEGATSVDIYLPDDEVYYDYIDYKPISGKGYHTVTAPLEKIPVFARGGHIHVRRERERRSSGLMKHDPYTIVVAVSKAGKAQGELYVDDGESYEYQVGEFIHQQFEYDNRELRAIDVHTTSVPLDFADLTIERVVFLGGKAPRSATVVQGGKSWEAEIQTIKGGFIVRNPAMVIGREWSIKV